MLQGRLSGTGRTDRYRQAGVQCVYQPVQQAEPRELHRRVGDQHRHHQAPQQYDLHSDAGDVHVSGQVPYQELQQRLECRPAVQQGNLYNLRQPMHVSSD